MKPLNLFYMGVLHCLLVFQLAHAQQLIVFPQIPGRAPSDKYQCRVRQVCDTLWHNAFVGQTYSQATAPAGNGYIGHLVGWSASWVAFEFEDT